ncbi:MAG: hypothetical protein CMP98_06185 [Gammaproteobacteria bacterium]|nr:hypothetical protein [Gammaproteobacteria bacterium]
MDLTAHYVSDDSDVLRKMVNPAVNLCLWRRPIQTSVAQELSVLQATDLPDFRHRTTLATFDDDLINLFNTQGLDPDGFVRLRSDLHLLITMFSRINHGQNIRFRLLTTDENDCKRFHLDRQNLRLMCTYQGPGTEWIPDNQVNREALSTCASNASILLHGQPCQFETFWVGLTRGDPANVGTGLVHRSPTIEDTGQIRALFCLDC